jgi:hypothetical protein
MGFPILIYDFVLERRLPTIEGLSGNQTWPLLYSRLAVLPGNASVIKSEVKLIVHFIWRRQSGAHGLGFAE